jgi:hypothetical protein
VEILSMVGVVATEATLGTRKTALSVGGTVSIHRTADVRIEGDGGCPRTGSTAGW